MDESIIITVSFCLYSDNDLNNPILVKEHVESSFYFDENNSLPNGNYCLAISIDSVACETYLNDIKVSVNYYD